MATCREVVYSALRKIQITAAGETPEAVDLVDSLAALNQMMVGLKLDSIDVDWRTLTADDTFPLPDEHVRGIVYLLAVELAPDYGREVDPAVATNAERARILLQAAYTDIPEAGFDPALRASWPLGTDFDIVDG